MKKIQFLFLALAISAITFSFISPALSAAPVANSWQKVKYLYPSALPVVDFEISNNGSDFISKWNTAKLGPKPSMQTINSVTDVEVASVNTNSLRLKASAVKDLSTEEGVQWRAVALILLDEVNTMRQWDMSFKAAVASSTSLADLKTRVAALPTLSGRTVAQLKAAYANKINVGDAD